ncbi:MAG: DMT family transporter [Methylobacteriaceae bacterium]|nr:DMT family transporter [Methylobacteriaceae bacterium]
MKLGAVPGDDRVLSGIGLAVLGYSVFSIQDATVKWLVQSLPVFEILFVRSLTIAVALALHAGPSRLAAIVRSPTRWALLARSVLILLAWISYYTAARSLPLAQLVTMYFATPIFVVALSIFILGEQVGAFRWGAVLAGFAGVVIAANPGGSTSLVPAGLTLFAAFCWAMTNILVRLISRVETTRTQMLAGNATFALGSALALPIVWVPPDPFSLALMLMLGVAGGAGQFLVFESFRFAPASVVAPFEYVGLIFAFVWGFVIWRDVPRPEVFAGAGLILASGLVLLMAERRRRREA